MKKDMLCPCESNKPYAECCQPVHQDINKAITAEALMRSRYSACALMNADFMYQSWHPDKRPESVVLYPSIKWIGLTVKHIQDGGAEDETGEVEFVARCKTDGRASRIHERSHFCRHDGHWVYLDGELK